jgi:two-component system, LytTR family, response regulator LytT
MSGKRILIVEDELIIAETIKEMVEELGHEVLGIAPNVKEALDLLHQESFDLALLDINLNDPEGNGFEVAQILQSQYKIPFVFITAYSDAKFLEIAKSLNPKGYVLKPLNKDRLFVALELAIDNAKNNDPNSGELQAMFQDSFFVKDGIYIHKINFEEILFLKSDGNYTEIETTEKRYLIRSLLKQIIEKLPTGYFRRVHRSYIINIKKVSSIGPSEIILAGAHKIPVGETYQQELNNLFSI